MIANNPELIQHRLREPFLSSEVKWRVWELSQDKSRALMVSYIDARSVMERLDEVLGIGGWQTSYVVMNGGDAVCNLRLKIGEEWIQRGDVGNFQVENKDQASGMAVKGAFSEALKRAAVNFGIGRYLYAVPKQWVDWDAKLRVPKVLPEIPEEFLCEKEREEVRKRRGSNGKYVPPPSPTEAPKPDQPIIAKHAILWKNLSESQQVIAGAIANAIFEVSGKTGSREELSSRKGKIKVTDAAIAEYLDAYFDHCWEMTPARNLVLENQTDPYESVPY